MSPLYSVPLPLHHPHQHSDRVKGDSRKRKRNLQGPSTGTEDHKACAPTFVSEQYAAVLSPQERVQRNLAKYPLLAELPPSPFPQSAPKAAPAKAFGPYTGAPIHTHTNSHVQAYAYTYARASSLKAQHVAAITAVLHRSLQQHDYTRARRALGLLLRTDLAGKPIDIRAAAYWNMGGEILLQTSTTTTTTHNHLALNGIKAFYETLIIQHPFHKPQPHRISAMDFYLALFSLWIYIAQAEASRQQDTLNADPLVDDYHTRLQDLKRAQLREAKQIAERLDRCLSSAPYSSNQDLLRMRAMVALWQADLNEASYDGHEDNDYVRDAVQAGRIASQILDRLETAASKLPSDDDMEY